MIDESELPELIQKPELIRLFNDKMIVDTLAALWKVHRAAKVALTQWDHANYSILRNACAALDDGKGTPHDQ